MLAKKIFFCDYLKVVKKGVKTYKFKSKIFHKKKKMKTRQTACFFLFQYQNQRKVGQWTLCF